MHSKALLWALGYWGLVFSAGQAATLGNLTGGVTKIAATPTPVPKTAVNSKAAAAAAKVSAVTTNTAAATGMTSGATGATSGATAGVTAKSSGGTATAVTVNGGAATATSVTATGGASSVSTTNVYTATGAGGDYVVSSPRSSVLPSPTTRTFPDTIVTTSATGGPSTKPSTGASPSGSPSAKPSSSPSSVPSSSPGSGGPKKGDAVDPMMSCRPDQVGCSDCQREGFVDQAKYPNVAGCSGGWSIEGMWKDLGGVPDPKCGRISGDDSTNKPGTGCNVEDLCANGWHVCSDNIEFAKQLNCNYAGLSGGATCCDPVLTGSDVTTAFFATRQRGVGCGVLCQLGLDLSYKKGNNYDPEAHVVAGCTMDAEWKSNPVPQAPSTKCDNRFSNDLYGCGNLGKAITGQTPARIFNKYSDNNCKALTVGNWSCGGTGNLYFPSEAMKVTKNAFTGGGVLCCRGPKTDTHETPPPSSSASPSSSPKSSASASPNASTPPSPPATPANLAACYASFELGFSQKNLHLVSYPPQGAATIPTAAQLAANPSNYAPHFFGMLDAGLKPLTTDQVSSISVNSLKTYDSLFRIQPLQKRLLPILVTRIAGLSSGGFKKGDKITLCPARVGIQIAYDKDWNPAIIPPQVVTRSTFDVANGVLPAVIDTDYRVKRYVNTELKLLPLSEINAEIIFPMEEWVADRDYASYVEIGKPSEDFRLRLLPREQSTGGFVKLKLVNEPVPSPPPSSNVGMQVVSTLTTAKALTRQSLYLVPSSRKLATPPPAAYSDFLRLMECVPQNLTSMTYGTPITFRVRTKSVNRYPNKTRFTVTYPQTLDFLGVDISGNCGVPKALSNPQPPNEGRKVVECFVNLPTDQFQDVGFSFKDPGLVAGTHVFTVLGAPYLPKVQDSDLLNNGIECSKLVNYNSMPKIDREIAQVISPTQKPISGGSPGASPAETAPPLTILTVNEADGGYGGEAFFLTEGTKQLKFNIGKAIPRHEVVTEDRVPIDPCTVIQIAKATSGIDLSSPVIQGRSKAQIEAHRNTRAAIYNALVDHGCKKSVEELTTFLKGDLLPKAKELTDQEFRTGRPLNPVDATGIGGGGSERDEKMDEAPKPEDVKKFANNEAATVMTSVSIASKGFLESIIDIFVGVLAIPATGALSLLDSGTPLDGIVQEFKSMIGMDENLADQAQMTLGGIMSVVNTGGLSRFFLNGFKQCVDTHNINWCVKMANALSAAQPRIDFPFVLDLFGGSSRSDTLRKTMAEELYRSVMYFTSLAKKEWPDNSVFLIHPDQAQDLALAALSGLRGLMGKNFPNTSRFSACAIMSIIGTESGGPCGTLLKNTEKPGSYVTVASADFHGVIFPIEKYHDWISSNWDNLKRVSKKSSDDAVKALMFRLRQCGEKAKPADKDDAPKNAWCTGGYVSSGSNSIRNENLFKKVMEGTAP